MTEWTLRLPTQAERVDLAFALLFKIWAVLCLGLLVGAVTGPHGLPVVPMALVIFALVLSDILSCLGRCLNRVLPEALHDQTCLAGAEASESQRQTVGPEAGEGYTG